MKINSLLVFTACLAALCVGCQSRLAEQSWSKDMETMLVQQQLEKIMRSQRLSGSAPHVMAIGEIKNDTTLVSNDNIEFMKAMIASELTNSGLVMISTNVGGAAKRDGKVLAPSLVLYGKLIQRDFRKEDGRLQREFTLELSIVDLASGTHIWNGKSMVCINFG